MQSIKKIIYSRSRRFIRACLAMLPAAIKHPIMRSIIHISYDLSSDYTFKIAETKEELEQAFRILHDAYVGMDFMEPDPSGMRVTLYHAIPHTTTIIAKYKDQVIGTVSVIRENPLGLPLDDDFDISAIKKSSVTRSEISALALDKKFRGRSGAVLLSMFKYLYEYCTHYLRIDVIQMVTSPRRVDFYQALLGFQYIENRIIEDRFVNGAKMTALYVNLKVGTASLAQNFRHSKKDKNLHYFLAEHKMSNFIYPERKYYTVTDPVMTADMLEHFFCKVTDKFESLTGKQKAKIQNIYAHEIYKKILPALTEAEKADMLSRDHVRFPVKCRARLRIGSAPAVSPLRLIKDNDDQGDNHYQTQSHYRRHTQCRTEGEPIMIEINEVSLMGFMCNSIDEKLDKNILCEIDIVQGPFHVAKIFAKPVWQNDNKLGFKIEELTPSWQEFIDHLNRLVHKEEASTHKIKKQSNG